MRIFYLTKTILELKCSKMILKYEHIISKKFYFWLNPNFQFITILNSMMIHNNVWKVSTQPGIILKLQKNLFDDHHKCLTVTKGLVYKVSFYFFISLKTS